MSDIFEKSTESFKNKMTECIKNFEELKGISEEMNKQIKIEKNYYDLIEETLKKFELIDSDIVRINIGGTLFSTSKSTLTKKIKNTKNDEFYNPNLLECLVYGYLKANYDENKAIFIDRNPKYFGYILDYLRMANTESEFELSDHINLKDFLKELKYYNIKGLIDLINSKKYDSVLLDKNLEKKLIELCELSKNQKFILLYRATRDGFGALNFHSKCDYKSNTITIIKSTNGNIFGGYTQAAWDQSGSYKADKNSFIFSLINVNNNPVRIKCANSTYSIYCVSSYGPTFGQMDIYICDYSNSYNSSYTNLGTIYQHPSYTSGSHQANTFLAGSRNFQVSEIEVFTLD